MSKTETELERAKEEELQKLAEYESEEIAAAKRQTAALENGFKLSEILEFQAFTGELVEAIELGVFDGPHIKEIVAACFRRRAAVVGSKTSAPKTPAAPTAPATPAALVGSILGENDYLLRPQQYAARQFSYMGATYSKDDMKGKHLRTNTHGGLPWYFGGILAKIVAVGPSYVQIEWAEDPKLIHPNSTELRKKSANIGNRVRVSASQIGHIFG